MSSIDTDTGFNVKCACCAEYKSRSVRTGTQVLSQVQQEIYLISNHISKDGKTYVCRPCRKTIDDGKKPQKSEKNKFENSNFPVFLKKHLQKVSNYINISNKKNKCNAILENLKSDQALQLNRLESHLLKLIIPFIPVAHCTRGSYIKVKGSLILMSSDISHSMSRILPRAQNLLPVCLKRKLEYTGNYVEEIINENKVNAYFNFLKRYNPLLNTNELKESKIDQYEAESNIAVDMFDAAANKMGPESSVCDENEDVQENEVDSDSESGFDEFDPNLNNYFNPEKEKQNEEINYFRDESSVFCNKYEENVISSTVANRLANIIVEADIL